MDLDIRKKNILSKINSNNMYFDAIEKYIISNERYFQHLIISKLSDDQANINDDLFDSINGNNSMYFDDDLIMNSKFLYNFALKSIELADLNNIDDILAYIEDADSLLSILESKLQDSNYKLTSESYIHSNAAIELIIKNDRFDLIRECIKKANLTHSKSWGKIIKYIEANRDRLTLEELMDILKNNIKVDFNVFEIALLHIKEADSVPQNINLNYLFNICPDEQKDELFELLLTKKYICISYLCEKQRDISSYRNMIIESLDKGLKFPLYPAILKNDDSNLTYPDTVCYVLEENNLFWDFIERGQLDIIPNGIFDNNEGICNRVIQLIRNNPERFKEEETGYGNLIDIELIRMQDSKDKLNNFYNNVQYSNSKLNDILFEVIKEKIIKGHKVVFPPYNYRKTELIDFIINYGKLEYIEDFIELTDTQLDKIIRQIEVDENFKLHVFNKTRKEIIRSKKLLNLYLTDTIYTNAILEYIKHDESYESYYTNELYFSVNNYISKKYNLNLKHMDILAERYGAIFLHYIENHSIQKIIELDDNNFNRVMSIFPNLSFEINDARAIHDSLQQHDFSNKNPDILSIFNRISAELEINSEDVFKDFQSLAETFTDKLYKQLNENYPFLGNLPMNSPQEFFLLIKEKIQNGSYEEKNLYKDILHELTSHYILEQRGIWAKKNSFEIFKELHMPFNYEEKDVDKARVIIFLNILLEKTTEQSSIYLNQLCKKCEVSQDTLQLIYKLYIGDSDISDEDKYIATKLISNTIKQIKIILNSTDNNNFDRYNSVIDYILDNQLHINQSNEDIDEEVISNINKFINNVQYDSKGITIEMFKLVLEELRKNPPKKKFYAKTNHNLVYLLLTNLQVEVMEEHLLPNDEIVQALSSIMSKSKLHICPEVLKELKNDSSEVILSDGFDGISAFITYFYKIYEEEIERRRVLAINATDINMSITNILKQASSYGAASSIYAQILGSQNFRLIKSNPGPNSAYINVDSRLDDAVNFTIGLFERQEITIPSFIQDFESSSGKKLTTIIGNFKNPCNLTHGERTGACMRIGGAGESLFNFCLIDKNGFHITFRDSETDKYVSRVSGFRNGNTVFLNQLRDSCMETFEAKDLIDVIYQVAQELIIKTSESTAPICNVVIDNSYVMGKSEEKVVNFNIRNNKEGLQNQFYSDIGTSGIVLATTSTNNELVAINFEKNNIPTYFTVRESVIDTENLDKMKERIGRIHTIIKMKYGFDWRGIELFDFEKGIKYGFAGEDWYVYIDDDNNVHEDILDIDKRAEEEYKTARKIVDERILVKEEIYAKF